MSDDTARLLNTTEAANFLGLKPGTLHVWRSAGRKDQPPFRRHGRTVVYSRDDLIAWSDAHRFPSADTAKPLGAAGV